MLNSIEVFLALEILNPSVDVLMALLLNTSTEGLNSSIAVPLAIPGVPDVLDHIQEYVGQLKVKAPHPLPLEVVRHLVNIHIVFHTCLGLSRTGQASTQARGLGGGAGHTPEILTATLRTLYFSGLNDCIRSCRSAEPHTPNGNTSLCKTLYQNRQHAVLDQTKEPCPLPARSLQCPALIPTQKARVGVWQGPYDTRLASRSPYLPWKNRVWNRVNAHPICGGRTPTHGIYIDMYVLSKVPAAFVL
jgi:hypothetical protein